MTATTATNALAQGSAAHPASVSGAEGDTTLLLVRMLQVTFLLRLSTLALTMFSMVDTRPTVAFLVAMLGMGAVSMFGITRASALVALLGRHPSIIMADVLVAMVFIITFGPENPLVLATLTTAFIVGLLFPLRVGGLIIAVLLGGYVLARTAAPASGFTSLVAIPLLYLSLYAIGDAFRRASAEQTRAFRALAHAQQAEGIANERARLAREMHDSLAKTLHGIAIGAAALPQWVQRNPARAAEHAAVLAEGAERAAGEARAILTRMRADQPDRPLAEILGTLCAQWSRRHGIRCEFTARDLADLSDDVRYEMTAIAGEALENVARHADASRVMVELARLDGRVELRVVDNGNGFDYEQALAKPAHFGLQGMIERAREVGGELSIATRPSDGTVVTLSVDERKP